MSLRHNACQRAIQLLILAGWLLVPWLAADDLTPHERMGRDVFRELIEIDTTHEHGSSGPAAQAMARRLLDAGFPAGDVEVLGPPDSRNLNLVARLRGTGARKPILWLAHLDVVEARREDWSLDPFAFTEKDGFFYGRGTYDIKDGAAILVATFARLRREGYIPDRDLILALTAGEESGQDYNGVDWLLRERRARIEAAYCVNMDAGDPQIRNGKRILRTVQASEKVFLSLRLEVTNPGGHSSLPLKENAIYRLAGGLSRLAVYDFPARLNEVTRGFFERMAALEPGPQAADMKAAARVPPDAAAVARLSASAFYNAQLRTTCVVTQIDGGHAENALPQRARATVNCRMLPDEVPAEVEETIRRVLADQQIRVSVLTPAVPGPASPLTPAVMQVVEKVTAELWPGVPVAPVMETGATDGKFLRSAGIPTYGVSGVFIDIDDIRSHGRDERIGVKDYYDGLAYIDRLVRALSGAESETASPRGSGTK
jgi:acetylornithine deacetylase/succinyl-diaminopimelate desuccinylase-like protein